MSARTAPRNSAMLLPLSALHRWPIASAVPVPTRPRDARGAHSRTPGCPKNLPVTAPCKVVRSTRRASGASFKWRTRTSPVIVLETLNYVVTSSDAPSMLRSSRNPTSIDNVSHGTARGDAPRYDHGVGCISPVFLLRQIPLASGSGRRSSAIQMGRQS